MPKYFESYCQIATEFARNCEPLSRIHSVSFSGIKLCKGIQKMIVIQQLRILMTKKEQASLSNVFKRFKLQKAKRVNAPYLFPASFDKVLDWFNNNPGKIQLRCRDLQHVQVLYLVGLTALRICVDLFKNGDPVHFLRLVQEWMSNLEHLETLWTCEVPVILYDVVSFVCCRYLQKQRDVAIRSAGSNHRHIISVGILCCCSV